jgi:L-ascorbate metabolism protein UlaG (beta-lactamase superfamily)
VLAQREIHLRQRQLDASTAAASSLRFIGNATVVLRLNGITILTDPNFLRAGDHAHIGYGMTSRRLKDPAIAFEGLPHIDAVLLSHYHGDHFDHGVEAKLSRDMPIITNGHAAHVLSGKGFRSTHALETWESITIARGDRRVHVTALPGKHGPGAMAALLPRVMGSLVSFSSSDRQPKRLYISGDTLIHGDLHEIPKRFPAIDLALLHLGGTRVMGMLETLDGNGGVDALRIINPRYVVPIHYEEYTVMKSPLSEFVDTARAAGLSDRIKCLERGETIDL